MTDRPDHLRFAAPLAGRAWRLGTKLAARAQAGLTVVRERRASVGAAPSRGVAFAGTVWTGGDAEPTPGVVVVDGGGRVVEVRLGPRETLPRDLLVLGGEHHWVVPGIVDAHVHLGFDPRADPDRPDSPISGPASGLVAVRDLGAPMRWTQQWRTGHRPIPAHRPFVAGAGPVLTAPGGYPSQSWGADGYAEFVESPARARSAVQQLASEGVDLIKVALQDGGSSRNPWPVLAPDVLRAVVDAAHALGLGVTAHALSAEYVARALDAGVDEFAHTPTERLDPELISRIADSGTAVVSTLQTFFSAGTGRTAADNAADLVAAGVVLRYGTDLGNAGTGPGVDPRELDRIADTGLGRLGALRAATQASAEAIGMRRRFGRIEAGQDAALVLLPFSPLAEPGVWRTPAAVFLGGRLTVRQADNSGVAAPRAVRENPSG
ncbi:amidohydrolase family protein [Jatrophihabitans telluris]|uniref:Amidohydrolase family protein n=1 Tax=Jatrophihabitans telluris TaxID=2038343 RepID=A0ABY4QUR7_9ACTN|nr:amidohydrolase family protein [Jatrophihabitans telluris]UQX87173.1 amidohydrolase family protein [Jatrophihabitans telluris]